MTKRTNYLTEVAEDPFNTKRTNYVAICENESSRGPRSYFPRKPKVQEPMKKLANSLPPTISHQKKQSGSQQKEFILCIMCLLVLWKLRLWATLSKPRIPFALLSQPRG